MRLSKAHTLVLGAGIALTAFLLPASSSLAAEGVAGSRPLCQGTARLQTDTLRLQRIAGVCILTRPEALAARKGHGKRRVHTGKIQDTDTTYGDNVFQVAKGRAYCGHHEQIVTGGLQIVSVQGLFGGPPRTAEGESAPYLKRPGGWSVAFGSDLGGLARTDFRVVAVCERA